MFDNFLRTKIVCSIGPATRSREKLKELILNGMNVARINFSHGIPEEHVETIQIIQELSQELDIPVAIIQDLTGPKIRIGKFKGDVISLEPGEQFTLTIEDILGNEKIVSVNYKNLPNEVIKDDEILLDDGKIKLVVESTTGEDILCRVINGGLLSNNKGINVPDCDIGVSTLTDKDIRDLEFGVKAGVDFVAISFVRSADDIRLARSLMGLDGCHIDIIAKLETKQAIINLDSIIEEADGVMIARGDLGVELHIEELPTIQKMIINKANSAGKVVITATQMLESMIKNLTPTRAEASDVANAIFDGSGSLLLSGETSVGEHPIETLQMMQKIIKATEEHIVTFHKQFKDVSDSTRYDATDSICCAARVIAEQINAKAIVVFTQSGYSAISVSKTRPTKPIIAFTENKFVRNHMSIFWGVQSSYMDLSKDMDSLLIELREKLISQFNFLEGDTVVIVLGYPIQETGVTNLIKIHKLRPLNKK